MYRELVAADNAATRELVLAILNREYAMALTLDELPDLVDIHETYCTSGRGGFWVAVASTRIVGCIGVWHLLDDDYELRRMYVDAAERGRGIAQRLLALALDWCRNRGVRSLWLETNIQWRAARHIYAKHGFEAVPRDALPASFPVVRVATDFCRLRIDQERTA